MIRIVTDSSCDLPDEILQRHRITVVPLTICFGDESFVDREELSIDNFWDRLGATTPSSPDSARWWEPTQARE